MRRIVVLACAAAMLGGAPAAAAASAAAQEQPPAAAQPVTPAKLALVRRYFQAIHYEKMVDTMMASMLPVMSEAMARQHPNLTAAQQQMITGVVRQVMRDDMTPKIMERLEPVFAATFTEAELQAMVAFYEGPAGRAVVERMPALAPQSAQVMRSLIPEMQAEVVRKLCAELGGCDAAAPSARKSS
jgi:hypothetical protein